MSILRWLPLWTGQRCRRRWKGLKPKLSQSVLRPNGLGGLCRLQHVQPSIPVSPKDKPLSGEAHPTIPPVIYCVYHNLMIQWNACCHGIGLSSREPFGGLPHKSSVHYLIVPVRGGTTPNKPKSLPIVGGPFGAHCFHIQVPLFRKREPPAHIERAEKAIALLVVVN